MAAHLQINSMKIHGQIDSEQNARWCKSHNEYHGPLYDCEMYPAEIREEIEKLSQKNYQQLSDPQWIQEQLNSGVSVAALRTNQFFAGLG